ncbi:MAG TPA: hypothetical protein VK509_02225, partial [Polyangiales bacterium]|nr:hypothetical protein [Polyangiales bacterium]
RLTDLKDRPISGVPIGFALLGRPQDASLGGISALTDEDGVASTTIMAGAKAAAFNVRVSAPGAYEQLVDVAISNKGFGTLVVRARYDGPRKVAERTVVTRAASCKELSKDGIGDAMLRLPEGQAEVQFLALPAGIDYAVLAFARGEDGTVVAQGCLEGVRVRADASTQVEIAFSDEPISVDGELALHADLITDEVTGTLLITARNAAIAAVVNDVNGRPDPEDAEARFLLDSLDSVLRSEDYAQRPAMLVLAEDLARARLANGATGPEPQLQARLADNAQGPLAAVAVLEARAEVLLGRMALDAELSVAPQDDALSLGLRTTRLSATGVARGEPAVVLDLPTDAEPLAATAVLAVEADRLMLEPSELKVTFGALALQVLRRVATTDVLGHGAELRAQLGCERLAEWLAAEPGTSACDDGCLQATCDRAVARLLGAAETALLGLDEVRPTITLAGPFELGDDDGDLQAERMSSDALTGSWSAPNAEQPIGDALTGSATVTAAPQAGPITTR